MTITSVAFTFAIASERYADEVVLNGGGDNTAGDIAGIGALPAGFGDCVILEAQLWVANIDLMQTAAFGPFTQGWDVFVADAAGAFMDFVGAGEVHGVTTGNVSAGEGRLCARAVPDQPVLWRQFENLVVRIPSIDADATPTGDWRVVVRVRRLRTSHAV